jgi:putative membrane protein
MNLYLLFKSLHLIAVISWMAGLLYLPRIFVYHSEANHESQKNVFKTMERKLYNYIMLPAMLLSWLFGVLLIHSLGFNIFLELWMQIKIISVSILTYYHFLLGKYLNDFAIDANPKSSKFFRIINEVPTIILIVVVFVVVFKPLI